MTTARTRNQLRMDFKNLYGIDGSSSTQDVYKYFELAIEYTSNGDSKSHSYAVQHAMMSLETQKKSLPENFRNIDIKKWARGQKLFPWVAVAAPLKVKTDAAPLSSRVLPDFCSTPADGYARVLPMKRLSLDVFSQY